MRERGREGGRERERGKVGERERGRAGGRVITCIYNLNSYLN